MLADSLLPIPFWAEAINTACYVLNRVLVIKPHDSPLSGGHTSDKAEGALNLQELSVLCTNLSNRVLVLESIKDAQAAEISALKIRIKRFGKQESVSKQGRKKSKPKSTLDDNTVFEDQDADHGIEYMETKEAVDEGRQSGETEEVKLTDDTEVVEDKSSGDKGGNAKELVSTARPEVSTARLVINALGYSTFRCNPDLGVLQIAVMSSASSAVTYTFVYTDSEPGRPVAPPSPDYIPGPENPQTPPVPQDEDEREAMFIQDDTDDEEEDEEEEEHPAPANSVIVIPTVESDFPPEGTKLVIPPPSTDISTTGARITVWLQASISLPPEAEVERLLAMPTPSPSPPISLSPPSSGEHLARYTTPPAHLSSPPVPSPLLPSSGCPTQIQTLRIASTQALIDAVTATLPSPPLPPSLYIPPHVDCRNDLPESEQPPRKRLCLSTLGSKYEVGESFTARPTRGRGIDYGFVSTVDAEARRQGISEVGYGYRDTWVDPAEAVPEVAPMTVGEVNTRVIELVELHERNTQDLYALLEDAQDGRTHISQQVAMDSQRVNLLMGNMMTLQEKV
ncbi:hypothetical protein Tco_1085328 [Tanacetum coccineum]